jgi:hypothetical protein
MKSEAENKKIKTTDRNVALRRESQRVNLNNSNSAPAFDPLKRTISGLTPVGNLNRKVSIMGSGARGSFGDGTPKQLEPSVNLANFKKAGNKIRSSLIFAQALLGKKPTNIAGKFNELDEEEDPDKQEGDSTDPNVLLGKRRNYKQVDIDSLEQDELLEVASSFITTGMKF